MCFVSFIYVVVLSNPTSDRLGSSSRRNLLNNILVHGTWDSYPYGRWDQTNTGHVRVHHHMQQREGLKRAGTWNLELLSAPLCWFPVCNILHIQIDRIQRSYHLFVHFTHIDLFYQSMDNSSAILPTDCLLSPSCRDGVEPTEETMQRAFGCELIQEAGTLLKQPQVVMVTAQNLLHRFFYRFISLKYTYFLLLCYVPSCLV